ncbi:putative threonine dehydratase isoform X1 [Mya arenaria]|uniref:putative threonine dehydratase isoform X1 n=1 Tax=Mya arenaria TaxID=6604 RepID=UPI0022E47453|nr:putative threonine dehydratase isoform X1 [Mya arenaria]
MPPHSFVASRFLCGSYSLRIAVHSYLVVGFWDVHLVAVTLRIDTRRYSMEHATQNLGEEVARAYERIRTRIWKTPLMFSSYLSVEDSTQVYLKLDSEQITGSFKVRGAFNKILTLKKTSPEVLTRGFTTASTGNHGLACLYACGSCGCALEIFCREGVCPSKLAALQSLGATVTLYGQDCVDAEIRARHTAESTGRTYISPYNDVDVMAGNGTVGYEIYEDLPEVDYVLVAVGGGGFIGGAAAYLKHRNPNIQVIGCQPRNSKVMYESVKAGHIVHEPSLDTLSDGTSGDVEDKAVTFPVCARYVDDWILVGEQEISDAVYHILNTHHKIIEGSAGVTVAAYLANKDRFKGSKVVLVLCGANIATDTLRNILDQHKT